ncbi:biotin--[acetyl-CoA-carboxylase] ligase [Guyparkeria sp.]|uniref:biotin--[acetyl-CoA-carboxylase] ligase n=1 Tax=Guyparkeria sp. TaxID=2035736 RepID=UPI0039704FD4
MSPRSVIDLDFPALSTRLARSDVFAGWREAFPPSVDSTNRLVHEMAAAAVADGQAPRALVVAGEQSAGRGRRGTAWHSGAGAGLWFSLVVPDAGGMPNAPPALAIAARLAAILSDAGIPAAVKWPNDLYLDGGKLGGLLLERFAIDGRRVWLAGIGINWRAPRAALPDGYRAVGLAEWSPAHRSAGASRQASVDLAVRLVEGAGEVMCRPESWPGWVESLRRRHWLFGAPVEVRPAHGGAYHAQAAEMGDDGLLTVQLPDGTSRTVGPNDRVRPRNGWAGATDETTREFQRQ